MAVVVAVKVVVIMVLAQLAVQVAVLAQTRHLAVLEIHHLQAHHKEVMEARPFLLVNPIMDVVEVVVHLPQVALELQLPEVMAVMEQPQLFQDHP